MFLDEASISVTGGQGGRGCVSWRREKFIPKGGPDGGEGGKGGDVILVADENTDTLSDFAARKRYQAPKGDDGKGKNMAGKSAEDLLLHVPPGTIITEITEGNREIRHADLERHGDQMIAARGGRGGYGNAHFKSSVRQRPDFAELGEPGEQKTLKLELKLVADVGIIGYPSVGKSMLISVISGARPKVADYPFTTLVPNLGVVTVSERSYIVCDVPGLIEGASEGKGLGDAFLKHIERCGVLLHMLDISRAMNGTIDASKLAADYRAIRKELEAHSPALAEKRELIILNKIDLTQENLTPVKSALKKKGIQVFAVISAATRKGTVELTKALLPIILAERSKRAEVQEKISVPVLKPHLTSEEMGAYRIEKKKDGSIAIYGKRLEQFVKMTNFKSEGGVKRFLDVVRRIGLWSALERETKEEDTPITIAGINVREYL